MPESHAFDQEKFEELIVYLAHRLGPEAALGRVKLAKLLAVCDFTAYAQLGKPMTGATYEKWEHGHLPHELLMVQRDLEADGAIEVEAIDYFGKRLKRITALRDPQMTAFSEDEIGIIESTLNVFGAMSATQLRALSHEELGWLLAEDKETIPYHAFLLDPVRPPEHVFAEFRELHSLS